MQGAELEIEPTAYLDLRHDHRRKTEPANFALGGKSLRLDGDVVSAVFQRRDLGVVPLIAEPLSVCESVAFGPRDKALGGTDHTIALVWPGNADVCHAPCREVADFHPELVGIVPRRQTIEARQLGVLLDRRLELVATGLAPRFDVKGAGGYAESLLEAS